MISLIIYFIFKNTLKINCPYVFFGNKESIELVKNIEVIYLHIILNTILKNLELINIKII